MVSTNKKTGKSSKQAKITETKEKKPGGEKEIVKVNWPRITLLGFITSLIFTVANAIIAVIIVEVLGFDIALAVQDIMQYIFFGEVGFLVLLGACVGNFGQSVAISNLKARMFKSEPMTKQSFREATFNAFTYYIAAILLLVYLMGLVQVLILIERFS